MSDVDVMDRVRRALGRGAGPMPSKPFPPTIPEAIARLVPTNADLGAVFLERAKEQKMHASRVGDSALTGAIVDFMREHPIRRVAMASSDILERLQIREALQQAGIEVRRWDEMSLDELYDFDCAVTDVQRAVAENATLVVKPSAKHGRGLSLVPMFHVAVVERRQIIPDLIDLFAELSGETNRSNVILIAGPSKTADIEMNVVTGVHGPNVVRVFLLG